MIFTAQPCVFGSQIFTHRFWDAPGTAGRLKSIDEPCAMKPPTLELLPGTQPASTCFLPGCDPPPSERRGPWHPGQIFLACSRFSHLLKRNKTWDTSQHAFTGTAVAETLQHLIDTYGPPASTLTDNGLVFTARLTGRKGGRNAFEKTLNHHRIQQKNGRPGHPQTQGKIERFHQTLKNGSTPDHSLKPSLNCRHSSMNSATTTTPHAPTKP